MDNLRSEFMDYFKIWKSEYQILTNDITLESYTSRELEEKLNKKDLSRVLYLYDKTMYLDIWLKICNKYVDFFKLKIQENSNMMIKDIVENLFYLSKDDISDYINEKTLDFVPNYDLIGDSIEGFKVSKSKKYKVLMMICKKIDYEMYESILMEVERQLDFKRKSINAIKILWNNIGIEEDGSINISDISVMALVNFINTNPIIAKEYIEEVENYYMLLCKNSNEISDEKAMNSIASFINKIREIN